MRDTGECCAKCRFVADRDQNNKFECHRYPPVSLVEVGVTVTSWPRIRPNDWCGEYRRPDGAF